MKIKLVGFACATKYLLDLAVLDLVLDLDRVKPGRGLGLIWNKKDIFFFNLDWIDSIVFTLGIEQYNLVYCKMIVIRDLLQIQDCTQVHLFSCDEDLEQERSAALNSPALFTWTSTHGPHLQLS